MDTVHSVANTKHRDHHIFKLFYIVCRANTAYKIVCSVRSITTWNGVLQNHHNQGRYSWFLLSLSHLECILVKNRKYERGKNIILSFPKKWQDCCIFTAGEKFIVGSRLLSVQLGDLIWFSLGTSSLTITLTVSVTRLGDLLDFVQLFKFFGNN